MLEKKSEAILFLQYQNLGNILKNQFEGIIYGKIYSQFLLNAVGKLVS